MKQLSIRSTEKKQDESVSSSSDLVKNITTKTIEQVTEQKSTTTTTEDNEEDDVKTSRMSAKIENLLDSLPFCMNADLVLNFAVDFVTSTARQLERSWWRKNCFVLLEWHWSCYRTTPCWLRF